jgi:hypothetical protein
MTLQLDFQSRAKPLPWAGVALLALAALVLTLCGVYYSDTLDQTAYWEAKSGLVDKDSRRQANATLRETKDLALEIRHANEVLNQLTLPWDSLFQAVEWSAGKDVALLGIEPDAERREVKISGEGKNIGAVLEYIRHLSAQEAFSGVYLQSHQVQEREREKPVRFALVVTWKVAP